MSDETVLLDPPVARSRRKAPDGATVAPVPCVGLPVQFVNHMEVVPGILQRQSVTDPALWDVKLLLTGASVLVTRPQVRHSAEPKEGCWSFLPGWRYEG